MQASLLLPSGAACPSCQVPFGTPSLQVQLEVQIRDLDQTVIGNPAHDLIRLGLSLASSQEANKKQGSYSGKTHKIGL